MLTVENVLAWIRTLPTQADNYYAGTLDAKKPKSFGVYSLKDRRRRDIALGGLACTKSRTKGISILVHWTASTRETETKAQSLYSDLETATAVVIDDAAVGYIELLHNEPIDVGADDSGIQERVIEFIIHYERS